MVQKMDESIEKILPNENSVFVKMNSLRLKLTDNCHWNCWWCHNEGTGKRDMKVTRNLDFSDSSFLESLEKLLDFYKIKEVHLTGGEPTLHPEITGIITYFKEKGLRVKITSMGNRGEIIEKIIDAGIDSINFSLHALTLPEMCSTQVERKEQWIDRAHQQLLSNILLAKTRGIRVKINTVVASEADFPRIRQVIDFGIKNNLEIRLLHEVSNLSKSINAVLKLLDEYNAKEVSRTYTYGFSGGTILYNIPNLGNIGFKVLIPVYLESMCSICPARKEGWCGEYFYGIRLENVMGNNNIRLCVHRTAPDTYFKLSEFLETPQADDIKDIIDDEKFELKTRYLITDNEGYRL